MEITANILFLAVLHGLAPAVILIQSAIAPEARARQAESAAPWRSRFGKAVEKRPPRDGWPKPKKNGPGKVTRPLAFMLAPKSASASQSPRPHRSAWLRTHP